MISKTNLARFQGKVFLLGTIVIAVLIVWSLFGSASGQEAVQVPQADIFELIALLLDLPLELILTTAVLILAVIIAIPIILILRRKSK
jgi:hypothetical protein